MTNTQRLGSYAVPTHNFENAVESAFDPSSLLERRTSWSSANNSAAGLAQPHTPRIPFALAPVVTAAPVNWESIRRHRRR